MWKDRNKKEFESLTRSTPLRTVERAHKEWLEQVEVEKSKGRKSTEETVHMHEQHNQGNEAEGTIVMDLATATMKGLNNLGIGVTVRTSSSTKIAEWKLKERSLGNKVLDAAQAVKLLLCKAVQYQWSRIRLNLDNKEPLKQIAQA